ncbi:hypothetical protein GS528_17175 [Rhodococcus hoagii]|nr:hypothetical protein [Prescottella equi]
MQPGKRPASTLTNGLLVSPTGPELVFGAMGGEGEPQTQAALVTGFSITACRCRKRSTPLAGCWAGRGARPGADCASNRASAVRLPTTSPHAVTRT